MPSTDNIVEAIIAKDFSRANDLVRENLLEKLETIMAEKRKQAMVEYFNHGGAQPLEEAPAFKIIRVRIRKGKIQRRKKVSNKKGYTIRKGRLVRMSPTERRHRKMGARRAKIKRRAKKARIRLKTQRSMRRRKSLGLDRRKRR